MKKWSEANKYTLYGVLFGTCFPISARVLLYFTQADSTWITLIYYVHTNPLLYLIDTAPVVLGLIARIAGVRQDKINNLVEGLEDLVKAKTMSLMSALEAESSPKKIDTCLSQPIFIRCWRHVI